MSHSNQCECAGCQTKSDIVLDEARVVSRGHNGCFFDDLPATALLNGTYLCESHAICNTCLKTLTEDGLTCRCEKYGYTAHWELLWCSQTCHDQAHPESDLDDQEEGE